MVQQSTGVETLKNLVSPPFAAIARNKSALYAKNGGTHVSFEGESGAHAYTPTIYRAQGAQCRESALPSVSGEKHSLDIASY
jgi:hypothetical protein